MRGSRSPHDFIAKHVLDIPRSGIRDFFDIVAKRKGVISLGIGEPDFVTPWHIREASMFALEKGATQYTANLGLLELRQAISRYVHSNFGPHYDPETEILVTVGVSEALDLAIRAVLNPGDELLYHEPCFVSYSPVTRLAHGKPVAIPTFSSQGFTIQKSRLDEAVSERTKVLLINFPTNPTGAILSLKKAREIADFAIRHDLLVISDEIYAELTYGKQNVCIASLPRMRQRTILLNGFSKSWAMTGFRIGFVCAPAPLIEAMMKIHQYTMMCAPILSQRAAIQAINRGDEDKAAMRLEYERRRNYICAALNEMGLPCHRPEGAFYAFPLVAHYGMSSREFALRLLDAENVACVPGSAFGEAGEGYLRCAFAVEMDDLKEAVRRMERFVRKLRRKCGRRAIT